MASDHSFNEYLLTNNETYWLHYIFESELIRYIFWHFGIGLVIGVLIRIVQGFVMTFLERNSNTMGSQPKYLTPNEGIGKMRNSNLNNNKHRLTSDWKIKVPLTKSSHGVRKQNAEATIKVPWILKKVAQREIRKAPRTKKGRVGYTGKLSDVGKGRPIDNFASPRHTFKERVAPTDKLSDVGKGRLGDNIAPPRSPYEERAASINKVSQDRLAAEIPPRRGSNDESGGYIHSKNKTRFTKRRASDLKNAPLTLLKGQELVPLGIGKKGRVQRKLPSSLAPSPDEEQEELIKLINEQEITATLNDESESETEYESEDDLNFHEEVKSGEAETGLERAFRYNHENSTRPLDFDQIFKDTDLNESGFILSEDQYDLLIPYIREESQPKILPRFYSPHLFLYESIQNMFTFGKYETTMMAKRVSAAFIKSLEKPADLPKTPDSLEFKETYKKNRGRSPSLHKKDVSLFNDLKKLDEGDNKQGVNNV